MGGFVVHPRAEDRHVAGVKILLYLRNVVRIERLFQGEFAFAQLLRGLFVEGEALTAIKTFDLGY